MATARKQSLRTGMGRASAGRCRACTHNGHARAWRTHAMNIYAHAKGFVCNGCSVLQCIANCCSRVKIVCRAPSTGHSRSSCTITTDKEIDSSLTMNVPILCFQSIFLFEVSHGPPSLQEDASESTKVARD